MESKEFAENNEPNKIILFKDIEIGDTVTFKPGDVIQTDDEASLRIPDPTKTKKEITYTVDATGIEPFEHNKPVYWQIQGSTDQPQQLTEKGITFTKDNETLKLLMGVAEDFQTDGNLSTDLTISLNQKTNFITNIEPTTSKASYLFGEPKHIRGNKLKEGSVINLKPGDKIGRRIIPDPRMEKGTTYYQTADMPVAETLTPDGFNFLINSDTPKNFRIGSASFLNDKGELEGSNPFNLEDGITKK